MNAEILLLNKIIALNYPYYLYVQLSDVDSENHNLSITVWRFPSSIVVKTHNINSYNYSNRYELNCAEEALKQIQYILSKNNSKISSVFELVANQAEIFSVDVFNDQENLTYSFNVTGNKNLNEQLVNTSFFLQDINCSHLIHDFKIVIQILQDQNIRCKPGTNNPFTYVRRKKLEALKSIILNA